ncbi:MAG: type transport system ATP-binding protein [Candidatus Woesearchaeota archaeon]|nr:type transport system ATP-binding protein [Candidatus Woesearchaeota archaeon]
MGNPLLTVEGMSKTFGKLPVLKGVSFSLDEGEILGIMGASGAGKTTLLSCIIGFLKPDKGDVKYLVQKKTQNGSYASEFRSILKHGREFKEFFGFAAQTPSFYDNMNVLENLRYFGKLYGLSSDTLKSNITLLLDLMSLSDSKQMLARNLSGGMKRRLDIACALIHNPKLLILDEPTSDLDPLLIEKIWDLIRRINKTGTTILLSSHLVNDLERVCSRVALLEDGMIKEIGSPVELRERFSRGHKIILRTREGNYDSLINKVERKFKQSILASKVVEGHDDLVEVVFICNNPLELMNYIEEMVESQGDEIIELGLKNPSLDQAFLHD